MAAALGNKNALGNSGGKSKNDRELAARVRSLALTEIEKYLLAEDEGYTDKEMKHAIILKLAPSLLPRLNEHTGEDGKDLFPVPILNGISTNNRNNQDQSAQKTPTVHTGGNFSEQDNLYTPVTD